MAQSISLRGVGKAYGPVAALDHIDLDIAEGEFFTLLGPSGSGKTTLLMVIAGFIRADRGSLKFGDTEVIRMPPHRREVGVVFQNYALFPHMSVAENIAYPLKLRGVAPAERAAKVETVLQLVRLGGLGKRRVHELSGGQRQRVALARAVVFAPKLLLMDEPLSALDKNLREQMQVELKRLHRSLGMTTIYVTHDQGEAMAMSDRVAVMDRGRIAQIGQPRDLYERPRSKFVARFIGDSNLIPAAVDGQKVTIAGRPIDLASRVEVNGARSGLLLVRPERLRILNGSASDELNRLTATVRDVIYRGSELTVYGSLHDGTEIMVRCGMHRHGTEALASPGDQVDLGFYPEDGVVVSDQ